MVPEGWSESTIGQVLMRVSRPVAPIEGELYREIGIRSHGKGVFHKDPTTAKALGNKRVFEIVVDAFVLNIVFAWEQAVARTTSAEQGFIASHRFPQFLPKEGQSDVDFLLYFFMTPKGKYLLELASPGGAGRNKTLGQKEFERLKLTMPPVIEQKKIAQILSTWDRAIATTEKLLANSQQQKKALMQQLLTGKKRLLDENGVRFSGDWEAVSLGEYCKLNPRRPDAPGNGLVTFIPMEMVSKDAKVLSTEIREYSEVEKGFTAFADGDVLVAKITPCFENGKGALLKDLENGIGFGSTEFHVLRTTVSLDKEYLYYLTNTREFRVKGELNMQGSAGQKRVPTDYIKALKVLIPLDVEEQRKIAAVLATYDQNIAKIRGQVIRLLNEKTALMQQLLTGKRRVKVDEVAA